MHRTFTGSIPFKRRLERDTDHEWSVSEKSWSKIGPLLDPYRSGLVACYGKGGPLVVHAAAEHPSMPASTETSDVRQSSTAWVNLA